MIFPVVLVVFGLFHVTFGTISTFCNTDTSNSTSVNDYFRLNVNIPQIGTYDLRTFTKLTSYDGTFQVQRPLNSVIIQARTANGRHYGTFDSNILTLETCTKTYDSLVGNELQAQHYSFTWQSEIYSVGDIQFWVAVQLEDGQDYIWVEGPKYRASTDYDNNDQPPPGESTTHKIYYIVFPSVLVVVMVVMVVGSMMVFSKVKYGTFCCCSDWGTPISYRYARKYAARQRRTEEADCEQPPSYNNAVQEENKIARQNVARYEMKATHDQDDITDDRAPLTGP